MASKVEYPEAPEGEATPQTAMLVVDALGCPVFCFIVQKV
jgi:hypothetical protein